MPLIGIAALLSSHQDGLANGKIEWQQVIDFPKGKSMPVGILAELVGIELGDTYKEAKAKLDKIAAELGEGTTSNYQEIETYFRLSGRGGSFVETKFISSMMLKITYPKPYRTENITVYLSAPSSGAQVYAIVRFLSYIENNDQPKISGIVPRITDKFETKPRIKFSGPTGKSYRYKFNDGVGISEVSQENELSDCSGMSLTYAFQERDVATIDRNNDCDVALDVSFNTGISQDHASSISFVLFGAERAKSNIGADYKFFGDYIENLRSGGGEGPKL